MAEDVGSRARERNPLYQRKSLAIKRLLDVFENQKHSWGLVESGWRTSSVLSVTGQARSASWAEAKFRPSSLQSLAVGRYLRVSPQGPAQAAIGKSVGRGVSRILRSLKILQANEEIQEKDSRGHEW